MNLELFEAQIHRLDALGKPSGEDALDTYFDALRDIPVNVFEVAITHALKTRAWFPKPAELRLDADHVYAVMHPAPPEEFRFEPLASPMAVTVPGSGQQIPVTRFWRYYCDVCSDTGWGSWWCGGADTRKTPWMDFSRCGRSGEHGGHEFVQHCACYDSNPALLRKRAAQQKYAETPQKVV